MTTVQINKIPKDIKITVSEQPMYLPQTLQEDINVYWNSLIASGKKFHRGAVFAIKEMKESANELCVTLHKTDFAHHIYTKHCKIPDKYKNRVIVANGLIVTKDNYIILGEMNKHTANPGRIQFVAGGIDACDIKEDKVDILDTLTRETKEEIGLDLYDEYMVMSVVPKYIVNWENIALVYKIQLTIDSEEFCTKYAHFEKDLLAKGLEPEFSSIELLPRTAVSDFLKFDVRPKSDFLAAVLEIEIKD